MTYGFVLTFFVFFLLASAVPVAVDSEGRGGAGCWKEATAKRRLKKESDRKAIER